MWVKTSPKWVACLRFKGQRRDVSKGKIQTLNKSGLVDLRGKLSKADLYRIKESLKIVLRIT